ncbi:helix-turn-helix domain-containing protein [Dyadobacter crusticola]|uniref:helix-turn-helix domain-containing protein n=1 Tax=Dyadobacter crusticola TaxID=292407 RepID=UPI0004E11024|nr:helix-turn-helix domain-containing protein [Dyadobacter crusticola]
MNRVELGRYIAARRQDLGLKQEDAAEMADLTAKTLYTIERGKGNPSLDSLEKLLDVLGLTINVTIRSTDDEGARL